ncbi:gap junction alpha-10 protein [Empidonax traillii]|uniref:gap junction alpha-10 protein n=1 Tax=Empidonax traillii TaxID=164674 RepID=UPI000FFCF3B9|nr:gap junction alpha-10 protein [Empidonax traillii]
MGDWNLLGSILEEVHIHSTIVGKIWLTILFIFRMLVLGVAAEDVWDDEQSEFICNTEQPGCNNICYDKAFPISLIRYWVLQIIFVSSPSLVYMGHALYRLRALEKERQNRKAHLRAQLEDLEPMLEEHRRVERELRKLEEQKKVNKAPLRGSLLRTYVLHILTRSVVEVGFMIGQYLLYGFHMSPLYKCTRPPCPNTVDCFVSRPTEKTIFMVFMNSIAAVSLFLNILEIAHLGFKKIRKSLWGQPQWPAGLAEEDPSLYNSKKSSVVPPPPCLASNAAPPRPAPAPLPPPPPAPGVPGPPPARQHRGQLRGTPPPRRRHHGQHQPSSSSEEAHRAAAPGGGAGAAGAAAAATARRTPRRHSRVSACRDLDLEERGDSPDSGHCPGTRKSSFLSRVLTGSRAGSDSEGTASRRGSGPGSGSGSGSEGKRREEGAPSPPPAANTGRRLSMASSARGSPREGGEGGAPHPVPARGRRRGRARGQEGSGRTSNAAPAPRCLPDRAKLPNAQAPFAVKAETPGNS